MLKLIPCIACLVSQLFLDSAYAQRDQSTLKIHYVPSDMHKNIAQYEKEFREIFLEEVIGLKSSDSRGKLYEHT